MAHDDTQFSAEYTYERKREGRRLAVAVGLILLYVVFTVGYFLLCYISGWIPLYAIAPILISMLIYFTWRRVLPDCYFEFRAGMLSLGYEMGRKRIRREKLKIHVKEADRIYPVGVGRVKLEGMERVFDISSSVTAPNRVCIIFGGGRTAAVFDMTPALSRLLVSYSEHADELADYIKQGKQNFT